MSKLLTALIAAGFGIGLNAAVAQNVDSDKDKARVQEKATQDKEQAAKPNSSSQQQGQSGTDREKNKADSAQPGNAQSAKTPQDCSNMSGKEKDKCIQATPAGPVNTETGQKSKVKSETGKERDREKAESPAESGIPAQSNNSVGRPSEQGTTGEGGSKNDQTGQSTTNKIPEQSKDTVGHPEERGATGEAQTLQEPGTASSNSSNDTSSAKTDKQPK
jgi:hypothetical protein